MGFAGYILYLITLYIRPQDWHPLFLDVPIDLYIFAFMLLMAAVNRQLKLRFSPTIAIFALWVLWIYFGGLINSDPDTAFQWGYSYLRFFIIFICTISIVDSEKKVRMALWAIILLSSVLGVQNIYQVINGVGWAGQSLGWEDSLTRSAGELGRAKWVGLWDGMNVMCLLFVTAVPVVFHFFLDTRSMAVKLLSLATGGLIITGAYLTKSRGGLAAILLVIIITLFVKYSVKSIKANILFAAVLLAFIALAPARMHEVKDQEHSAQYRIDMWEQGFDMLRWNTAAGVGRGNFVKHSNMLIAHNSFVEVMAETGVIGLFLWTSLLYLALKGLYRGIKAAADPRLATLLKATLISIVGYLVMSIFITAEFELLYLFIGISFTLAQLAGAKDEYRLKDIRNVLLFDGIFILFFYVGAALYWKLA